MYSTLSVEEPFAGSSTHPESVAGSMTVSAAIARVIGVASLALQRANTGGVAACSAQPANPASDAASNVSAVNSPRFRTDSPRRLASPGRVRIGGSGG